jgi:non-ribosomal peptide synthetase component E (peptide arylation enzyme)
MTENGICTTCDASTPLEKLLSTDGRPQPEVELRIVGPDGSAAGPDEEGRLLVRGPFNFVGYSQGREFTAGYFPDGDWFETGDLAYLDSHGYLRITGRTKDLVIRGGENIPVKEVEDALSDHPAIRDVAVVAVADDRLGERACACVSCYPGRSIDLPGIQRHLAEHRVAKPFWPELVRIYDELPRTPSGKVKKFSLREDLAQA